MSDEERTALFNDGKGREYPQTCPKCGAEGVEPSALARALLAEVPAEFACGSHAYDGGQSWHSEVCRIRELTAENERLREENERLRAERDKWHKTAALATVRNVDEAHAVVDRFASPPHTR